MEIDARRLRDLIVQSGLTHEEIAVKIGKKRLTVTRTINNRNVEWNTVADIVSAINPHLRKPVDFRDLIMPRKNTRKSLEISVS
jgi:transcriptional regulator with XRE-family HTH domain